MPAIWRSSRSARTSSTVDAALVGGVLGVVVGVLTGWSFGWVLLPVGLLLGTVLATVVLRHRLWVSVDAEGVESSHLRGVDRIQWAEVEAIGVVPSRMGRFGRNWTVGLCRRDHDSVLTIPSLTVRTPVLQRIGDEGQSDRLDEQREALLDPLLPHAEHHNIPIIDGDLVAWWDRQAPTNRPLPGPAGAANGGRTP